MSLKAIGMPVSGVISFRPMRSSARLAWASARSASTVMKALRSRFSFPMRARKARVSSTEEIFLAARLAASSPREALSTYVCISTLHFYSAFLLNYLRHRVQPPFYRRGNRLIELALIPLGHRVRPKPLLGVQRMGHRLYARGVDLAHFLDQ